MKKILVIVSMLIVAVACAAPPSNAPSTNANVATEPAAVAMTEAGAIAKEKAVWDTIKNKDYEAFGNMLADDQLEVMGEAVYDKAGSLAGIKDFEPTEVNFSDWKFLSIDKDAYVVVYTVNVKAKYKGKDRPAESDRCSSAWVNRAGKWLATYHQECPVKPPMPPSTRPAAKAGASPATTAATVAPGSDPIANEKMIWDFLKNKNYDAFAAALASDSIEVEPDGVFDKAGSVKSVSQFDFTKSVLSDFKTVKLDDDASLGVYLVKDPGFAPNGERHATIWANRTGKWLAVFHHGGTTVTKPTAMTETKPSASPSAKMAPSPVTKTP
jgi:hypothetical protein